MIFPYPKSTIEGLPDALRKAVEGGAATVTDVSSVEQAAFIASVMRTADPKRTFIFIAPTVKEAEKAVYALSLFMGLPPDSELSPPKPQDAPQLAVESVAMFPVDRISPYRTSRFAHDRAVARRRLALLFALSEPIRPRVLVVPAQALAEKLPPQKFLREKTVYVLEGAKIDRDELIESVLTIGYKRVEAVEEGGDFSVRGSIVDVYSPMHPLPLRLEFNGDVLTSARMFSPNRGRSVKKLEEAYITPVAPIADDELTRAAMAERIERLSEELKCRDRKVQALLEELGEGIFTDDLFNLASLVYNPMASFFDYLPPNTTAVMYEPYETAKIWSDAYDEYEKGYEETSSLGELTLPPSSYLLNPASVSSKIARTPRLSLASIVEDGFADDFLEAVAPSPREKVSFGSNSAMKEEIGRGKSHSERLAPLADYVGRLTLEGFKTAVIVDGENQRKRTVEILTTIGLKPSFPASDKTLPELFDMLSPYEGSVVVCDGSIDRGFVAKDEKIAVISEEEIFGASKQKRIKEELPKDAGELLESFDELQIGDYVVHADYGVGVYKGLAPITVNDVRGDFIQIEYLGGDKLFLPATKLERMHRYQSSEGAAPRLDRMGGTSWQSTRAKVKRALADMVEELLRLYAERKAEKGHVFAPPGPEYKEFEARFPFSETPDQLAAIEEIIADMTSDKITDRLVCGDVGFGKTEIAMRAAYLAVLDGKQVAVLVPTTVLAFQHLQTFKDRFRREPVVIEMLSRLVAGMEQKEILKKLEAGTIDILIGTHAILGKKIKFNNLGLLIIDEEHRFGVRHKEHLKQLKQNVDCITLTATPIPRTLQHSFVGLKDLSLIETPPPDRHAIKTQVVKLDKELIAEAIKKEINKGGQVYFVHNRVQSIYAVASFIQRLVPEARIAVAHGQMGPAALEKVFLDFVKRNANVLVTTTIIESGIDIPRVNTIFIHRADALGLAQLYQLRGRVGRGSEQAICYLIVPTLQGLSKIARSRLSALMRFTELGSGYKIARHDFELRGSGALIGEKQHGFIDSVGVNVYLDLLDEAIAAAVGRARIKAVEPDIKLQAPAYIPESYIKDVQKRLMVYKRLSSCASEIKLDDIFDEITDVYGRPPEQVELLHKIINIKIILKKIYATKIEPCRQGVKIQLADASVLDLDRFLRDVLNHRIFSVAPDNSIVINLPPSSGDGETLSSIIKMLHKLTEYCTKSG